MSYAKLKVSEKNSQDRIIRYMHDCNFHCTTVIYDVLVESPKIEIHKLNSFLNSNYTLETLHGLYRGKLGSTTFSNKSLIKAILIYIKNSIWN